MIDLTNIKIDHYKLRLARERMIPPLKAHIAARAVGVTKQSLSNYENGLQRPQGDVLARLCLLYRANIREIVAGDEKFLV